MKAIWMLVVAALTVAGGCTSMQSVPDELTEDGLTRTEIKGVDAAYVRKGTVFKQYRKIMLDPVQVAFGKDGDSQGTPSSAPLPAEDRERIRKEIVDLFMQVFAQELSKDGGIRLVTEAAPDVIRLSSALTDISVTPGRPGTYVMNTGRATLVAELHDSESGEILGRLFDRREGGGGDLHWSGSVQNSAEAQHRVARWAQVLRERIDAVRDAPATAAAPGLT